jgi:hypothetical protein
MNHTPKLSKQIKLLLLTADGSPGFEGWKNKVCKIKVCVSDADRRDFFAIFGVRNIITIIPINSFLKREMSCIFALYYGDGCDEVVDIGCCGCI